MIITRDEARQHLLKGWPVLYNGQRIEPNRRPDKRFAEPKLPLAELGGEFAACRHAHGWTRAGMAAIIRSGGSVMVHGRVISEENHLPPEDVLAMGDASILRQLAEQQEAELSRVLEQREETRKRLAEAEAAAKAKPKKQPAAPIGPRVQVIGAAPVTTPTQEEPDKSEGK